MREFDWLEGCPQNHQRGEVLIEQAEDKIGNQDDVGTDMKPEEHRENGTGGC